MARGKSARARGAIPLRRSLVEPAPARASCYRDFELQVEEAALALLGLGVRPGEHVALWATNWPQWVVLQFATARMGAVLVNINPAYRAHELGYVLDQADITTLFLTDLYKGTSFFNIVDEVCPELARSGPGALRSAACPRLRHVISLKENKGPGMLNWDEFRKLATQSSTADLRRRQAEARADDVVNIQF